MLSACREPPTLQNDNALKRHAVVNPIHCAWFSMEDSYDRECMCKNHQRFCHKAYIEEALEAASESLRIDSQHKVNLIVKYVMDRASGKIAKKHESSSLQDATAVVRFAKELARHQAWDPALVNNWDNIPSDRALKDEWREQKPDRLSE